MLGSGAGNGFSIWPNFGVYGLLNVWENPTVAAHFFEQHPHFNELKTRSQEEWTIYLKVNKVHGEWDGGCPFENSISLDPTKPIGVLTRATIFPNKLPFFWQWVPAVSQSITGQPGLIFSVGVGELPLVQQATFSLWENQQAMMNYAYSSHYHRDVVKKTREMGWYKEELFARFHPIKEEGSWNNISPLAPWLS